MARLLIREAHGGATREIDDRALPYFPGWVIIDTLDDSTDASPLYLSKAESDFRYALKGQVGGTDDTGVASLVADSASKTGVALRATFGTATKVSQAYASLLATPAAAISQAITDANAAYLATGVVQTVLLDARTWDLEAAVQLKSGVRVQGISRSGVVVRPTGLNPAFQFVGTDTNRLTDAALSDMTIDGVNQSGNYTYTAKGVYVMYTSRCAFERLTINNAYATALGLDYPQNTTVDDCIFSNAGRGMGATQYGGNGLGSLVGQSNVEGMKVSRCHATGCANIGFLIEAQILTIYNARGYQFVECSARNSGFHGFNDAGAYGATFTNCLSTRNSGAGFAVGQGDKPGSTPCPPGYGGVISGCIAVDNRANGILIDNSLVAQFGSSGYRITGCLIEKNDRSGIGVLCASFGDYNALAIVGNSILNNGNGGSFAGISLSTSGTGGASNLNITDNLIVGNSTRGIAATNFPINGGYVGSQARTDAVQTIGIALTPSKCTYTKFGGDYLGAAGGTPVSLAAGNFGAGCSVETPVHGWTRYAGVPALSAPKGTQYQRTDGAAGTLLYINTDGATAWTAYA